MRKVTLYPKESDTLALSVDNTTEANLRIDTHSGMPCLVNLGDGNIQMLASGATLTHVYTTNFTGDVLVTPLGGYNDISRFESTGSTAWNFDLSLFVPLTGLTYLILNNLPNANITGSLNSFSSATGLTNFVLSNLPNANIDGSLNSFSDANGLSLFYLINLPNANIDGSLNSFSGANVLTYFRLQTLPNANITGSLNSFSGANGLTDFWLSNLPNAIITGSSSDFAAITNLRDFLINVSPNSTITMDYDDILNIWQNVGYIWHQSSGISASKATTSPFNFNSLRVASIHFRNIGLSTASMDNMIIALDNSLIVQSSPKTIYLDQNAPHSGSPTVTAAISSLTTKNITLVL